MFRRCCCGYRLLFAFCLALCVEVSPVFAVYEVIEVTDGGTIKGQVIWKGDIPKIPPLKVFADIDTCGTQVPSPVLQIDPATNGIHEVLIYLERVEKGKAAEAAYPLRMGKSAAHPAGRACQFEQQVSPFVRTSEIAFINYEPILHNPHLFNDKHSLFNIAMPTADREIETKLIRARGIGLRVQCDVHVHMNAWAAAFDHPYFAVTDEQGRFEIGGIPPGNYTVIAWHQGYNIVKFQASRPVYDEPHILRQQVEITPKAQIESRFEFPARSVEVEWKIAGEAGELLPE
ncbi:MAG: hypothetical protein R3B37_00245 [Nitrospira sp.]|nr:hypothetical protein [Nitrospira sp.]